MVEPSRRRATLVAAIVCLQAVAAAFFLADAAGDASEPGKGPHLIIELVIAVALALGVLANALELRALLGRARRDGEALDAARGAMAELIESRFHGWRLTAAEADVAMLAIKGLSVEEIAALRQAAAGTVRAQLTRVYAKAGVSSRSALLALFIDDLLAEPLPLAEAA